MNPHQKPQEDVVVTQEDREAFKQLRCMFGPTVEKYVADGQYDDDWQMKLLARHRLLGHEAGRRDMREAAAKAAESLKREVPYDHNGHPCFMTMRRAAAAIRALPTEPLGGEG